MGHDGHSQWILYAVSLTTRNWCKSSILFLPAASLVCCLLSTLLLGLFPMRLGPPKQTREQTFFIKLSRFRYIFIY